MEPDRSSELEELRHRLRDAGIRLRPDLLPRVLDDYDDMKRHIAAVREVTEMITGAAQPDETRQ